MSRANPILPGFHPDPSVCRVGEWVYLATSTFEWYPGVRIYRSRDLSAWELAATPLDAARLLDMRGVPDSGGIWAPDISWCDGRFWLLYTDMRRHQGSVKDGCNYLVTAERIEGPWSDPVLLNASGFDPSLFHDEDGRSWLVQMVWSPDPEPSHFGGIVIEEIDRTTGRPMGGRRGIFAGSELGLTEGPHVYRRDGYYHLLTAEGGTGYGHACTWARSRDLFGPYELHPQVHILTAKDAPDHPIQRTGHGDLVTGPDGRDWLFHLMGRPIGDRRCVLGRECAVQEVLWRDGWPWVRGGPLPATEVDLPEAAPPRPIHYDFAVGLPPDFQWLRSPETGRLFATGPEGLTLFGRESIGSWHEQALVARRQTDFRYRAEASVDFAPRDERELAGLTCYYSRHAFYFAAITAKASRRVLRIVAAEANSRGGTYSWLTDAVLPVTGLVRIAVEVDRERLQFHFHAGQGWREIGPSLDTTILSDEASVGTGGGCFTGAFVGFCAVDMNGHGKPAVVSHFSYASKV